MYNRYPLWAHLFDKTSKRLNENSKIINVQGPVKVGKHELAKKLAAKFDLRFIPDVTCDDLFRLENGFDLRELNDQLKPWLQFVDLEAFYKEPNPAKVPGMARTQIKLYAARFKKYAEALAHVLNTGQGCVMVGGVFQDKTYADLLWKRKYFTREGYKYYKDLRANSICELWKPHVIIHYDAPVSFIRDQIKKRNEPDEVNSPVLTDDYIETLRTNIRDNIQNYKKTVEVLKFDARDLDFDIVVERLEALKLDPDILSEDMHEDWNVQTSDDFDVYRTYVTKDNNIQHLLGVQAPFTPTSKVTITGDDVALYEKIVLQHPLVKRPMDRVPKGVEMSHQWRTA